MRELIRNLSMDRRSWLITSCVVVAVGSNPSAKLQAASWQDTCRVDSFFVHADYPLNGEQALLSELGQLPKVVAQQLQVSFESEPVQVYLFHDQATYGRYLRGYFPDVPTRRAVYIKWRGQGMVFAYRGPELPTDLRHEATHAVLHSFFPMVPLWLDEGLAEYFEVPTAKRIGAHEHLASLQRQLRHAPMRPLSQLEAETDLRQLDRDDYRDAWGWVHFLLHGPAPIRREVQHYFLDLQAHADPGLLSQRLTRYSENLAMDARQHLLGIVSSEPQTARWSLLRTAARRK